MRNKPRCWSALSALLLGATLSAATLAAEDKDSADDSANPPTRPEYSARPLPADTFNPSEEISEDFPVPFPVDI